LPEVLPAADGLGGGRNLPTFFLPTSEGGVVENYFKRRRLDAQLATAVRETRLIEQTGRLVEAHNGLAGALVVNGRLSRQLQNLDGELLREEQEQECQRRLTKERQHAEQKAFVQRQDAEAAKAEFEAAQYRRQLNDLNQPPPPPPRPKTQQEQFAEARDRIRAKARRRRLESRELEECIAELTRDFENLKRDYPEQAERIDADLQREIDVLLENGFEAAQRR
jgi:hypothetical protein